jgi:two-component sensor histidine kinase
MLVVVAELASNAIQHTVSGRSWFAVKITWHGPVVLIAMADCGGPASRR